MRENQQKNGGLLLRWGKKLLRYGLCLLIGCSSFYVSKAQTEHRVNLNLTNASLVKAIEELRVQTRYNFLFNSDELRSLNTVTLKLKNVPLRQALDTLLSPRGLNYTLEKETVVIKKKAPQEIDMITVTGKISDEKGNPVTGATIVIHGTTRGVASDADGKYSMAVHPDDVLRVSFIGYKTEVVPVKGKTRVNVTLNPTEENLEEVTVVAFGTQKKESIVGSITTVRPMDLKTSSSDLTAGLVGTVGGVIGFQQSGLPVALTEDEMNTKFYIRGIASFQSNANTDPLILLDGVEISKLDFSRLAPEDIETFSVLKDASATAMYGARGANGVFIVTTKKGMEGSVYTTARYEAIVATPTRNIDVVNPTDYMRYYNQALLARSPGATPKYSVERINRTASGNYPSWVYPAVDWYDVLFHNSTVNHHAGVTARGGSKVVQYYASLNYNFDSGILKTDRLNQFDCNIKNNQVSFRANLNIDLKAGIKLVFNTSATSDRYHGPLIETQHAYAYAFNASPVDYAPTYPGDDTYNWPHIRFGIGAGGTDFDVNPYALTQQGYSQRTRFSTINRAEYIQNLSSLVKGLELRLSASLVENSYGDQIFATNPYYYYMSDYDHETGKHTLVPNPTMTGGGNLNSSRTLSAGSRSTTTDTRVTYEGRLYHTAAWGNHQTSATGVFQMYERTFSPIPNVLDGMPQRNLSYSARFSYGYKNRYFIEASGAYNGSERFAKHNRMGFFPSVGGAWVISGEEWMKPLMNVLPYLKLRVSYGKVGNDGIISTPRYVYLPTLGASQEQIYAPKPNSPDKYNRKMIVAYPNENIQWEIAETVNLGLDANFFNGIVEIQTDFYQEKRHNIISQRLNIPASMGIEVPPLDNVGRTCSRGIDFSGKIQHQFSRDLWVILNGTFTYNKTTFDYIDEAIDKPVWQRKKGKEISQQMGYIAEGLFRDYAEIANTPRQDGDVMPGDIRYRDINNDGVINVEDAVFIGYPETPRLVYGFSGFVNWKNFEFNFSFQGSGKRTFFVNPMAISPFAGNHAMLKAIADDHWSEENMDRHAFWPRLSTDLISQHNPYEDWYNEENAEIRKSTYFMRECRFLRCKSISLAYNLPRKWMDKLKMQNAKFTVSTNNPFCFTDFKLWDVELGENGFNYPIQRTYSVGLSVSF